MLTTLLGTIFGGVFRLFPEILKWLDRKDERKHELSMLDKQMESDRLRVQMDIQKIQAEADVLLGQKEIEAIIAATEAQGKKSGVRWIDGMSALMRPMQSTTILYGKAVLACPRNADISHFSQGEEHGVNRLHGRILNVSGYALDVLDKSRIKKPAHAS